MSPRRRMVGSVCVWTSAVEQLEDRTLLTAYVVNTLSDNTVTDGLVSFREAFTAADSNSAVNDAVAGQGGSIVDTITFAASLAGGTINVLASYAISGNLSITGLGASQLTLSANTRTIFFVGAGVTADLRGFSVSGSTPTDGGALHNAGTLRLTEMVVGGAATMRGGGIYSRGSLTLTNTTISGSTAADGGGIYNDGGTVSIVGSTISGNSAQGVGGGILDAGTSLLISNSTISGNTAGSGGGIYGAAMTLRNVTLFGNRAGSGAGGGLFVSDALLHNTIVAGNLRGTGTTADEIAGALVAGSSFNLVAHAGSAGGLMNGINGNVVGVNPATVLDAVLRDNGGPTKTHALVSGSAAINAGSNTQALNPGGSLLTTDQRGLPRVSTAQVDIGAYERHPIVTVDTLLDEDDGSFAPGDISLREAVEAATVLGAVATVGFSPGLAGGTIILTLGEITLNNITLIGGERMTVRGNGTARLFTTQGTTQIANLTLTGGRAAGLNSLARSGGAIFVDSGTLTVRNSLITGNSAMTGGGAIFLNGGTLSVHHSTLSNNVAEPSGNGFGGALYINSGQALISDSRVVGNYAGNAGGIVSFGPLEISRSSVSGNRSDSHGGGVYNRAGHPLKVVDSTISGNVAGGTGGGIFGEGPLTISGSTISGNSAAQSAGGVYNGVSYSLLMANSTVSGNTAVHWAGGIMNDTNGTAILRNVTVFGNRADSDGNGMGDGGGIRNFSGTSVTLYNTVVAGNVRGFGAGTPDDIAGTLALSTFNLIGSAASAGGLMNGVNGNVVGGNPALVLDPVLRDHGGPTKTHALRPGSPALDAGNDFQALDPSGNPLVNDQRGAGFPRVRDGQVDIGAFEGLAALTDLVGFDHGSWQVGVSNGVTFTLSEWAKWSDVPWEALKQGDFNGDGKTDVLGLINGQWYVGLSNGSIFVTKLWTGWANIDWRDVSIGDLNNDGRDDILAQIGGRWWAALSTGSAFGVPKLWASWANLAWQHVSLVDLDADGNDDLLGYLNGSWWAGLSTGNGFGTARLWAGWSNVAWEYVGTFDPDADGRTDVFALLAGQWWVARSNGTGFQTSLRMQWANLPWKDAVAGDFNGDGRDDLAARQSGAWWVSLSGVTGGNIEIKNWARWSELSWTVRVADFDGDGRDDIAGLYSGKWWVGRSTGTAFSTSLWGTWNNVAWQAIAAADFTGSAMQQAAAPLAVRTTLLGESSDNNDEELSRFWSATDDDEELAAALLGL